jgi:HEAT repeat protein
MLRFTAVLCAFTLCVASTAGQGSDNDKTPGSDELNTLVKNLRHRSVKTRLQTAEALGKMGVDAKPAAAKALCEATMDQSPQVRAAALDALQKVWPEIYKPLSTLILDKEKEKREAAIKEIGLMGPDAAPAATVLAGVLRKELAGSQPSYVRRGITRPGRLPTYLPVHRTTGFRLEPTAEAAFNALQAIKPQDNASLQILITIAKPLNKLPAARLEAIKTLNIIAGDDESIRKKVVPVLRANLLQPDNEELVTTCIELLGNYGKVAAVALPQLKTFKLSTVEAIREAANKAVDQIEN